MTDDYGVNVSGYIPPYEAGIPGVQPLDPDWVGTVQLFEAPSESNATAATVTATMTPTYGPFPMNAPGQPRTPVPAHLHADTNLLDARPEAPVRAPKTTHSLLLEVGFWENALGVSVGGFNNITAPHAMIERNPPLFGLMQPGSAAWGSTGAAAAPMHGYSRSTTVPGRNPALPGITYNAIGEYMLPYGAVVDVLVVNRDEGEHPIHLHGHAVWLVATSENPDAAGLSDHILRDTVSVPDSGGWARFLLVADNPGVWTFHCHIGEKERVIRGMLAISAHFRMHPAPCHSFSPVQTGTWRRGSLACLLRRQRCLEVCLCHRHKRPPARQRSLRQRFLQCSIPLQFWLLLAL